MSIQTKFKTWSSKNLLTARLLRPSVVIYRAALVCTSNHDDAFFAGEVSPRAAPSGRVR